MKRIVLISILLLFYDYGKSCSFIPDAFCRTMTNLPDDLVVSGIILGKDTSGIDLLILAVLRGQEARDTIRIWDGTDFDCNGFHSMAASDIGALNDTVILILPKIIFSENSWDVIGDYRRPNPYVQTSQLWVMDGEAVGLISGDFLAPPEFNLWRMDYDELLNSIIENGDCSSIMVSTHDLTRSLAMTVSNPFDAYLQIHIDHGPGEGQINLYSMTGIRYFSHDIQTGFNTTFYTGDLPTGIYLLEAIIDGRRQTRKLIKGNSD